MDLSGAFGRAVALVGDAVIMLRHREGGPQAQAVGGSPAIPPAKPQGGLPTLKMLTARGWAPGTTPVAAPGLKVNAFATGLKHPRWLHVLPDGAVLAAEALTVTGTVSSLFDYAMASTMRRAAAAGKSPNRITLLRDADGDGIAETRETFLDGLNQPFGMALLGDTFYVGNTDGVVAFPYTEGASRITAKGRQIATFKPGGHWTRSLLPSPDGSKLYVGVGSNSNIVENGLEAEQWRAAIWEVDRATGAHRIYAGGLRNPTALAFEPQSKALWAVVNERDELGPDLVPDYLTSVREDAFYGWPYSYWGQHVDPRVMPQRPDLVAAAIPPDYSLGSHVAPLGLVFVTGNGLPGKYAGGAFVGEHGSWDRPEFNGYKVVFVPFANGKPNGKAEDVVTGFLDADEQARGRPVGLALDKTGALLVADDVGNTVWRVSASGAPAEAAQR